MKSLITESLLVTTEAKLRLVQLWKYLSQNKHYILSWRLFTTIWHLIKLQHINVIQIPLILNKLPNIFKGFLQNRNSTETNDFTRSVLISINWKCVLKSPLLLQGNSWTIPREGLWGESRTWEGEGIQKKKKTKLKKE